MYLIKCYLIIVYEKRKKERKREYNEKKRERENTTGRRENANIMNSIGPQRVGQRELQWMHPTTGEERRKILLPLTWTLLPLRTSSFSIL